jgi:hypothetical protein
MAAAARTSTAKPYPGSMRSLLRMNGYRGLATGKGVGREPQPGQPAAPGARRGAFSIRGTKWRATVVRDAFSPSGGVCRLTGSSLRAFCRRAAPRGALELPISPTCPRRSFFSKQARGPTAPDPENASTGSYSAALPSATRPRESRQCVNIRTKAASLTAGRYNAPGTLAAIQCGDLFELGMLGFGVYFQSNARKCQNDSS